METNQPKWKCIAQLGDTNPINYGGYWILIDTTGIYSPKGEYYDPECVCAWHFDLDICTYQNGVLSDNRFHPDKSAWFASPECEKIDRPQDTTYLSNIAGFSGETIESLIELFCSPDPILRARGYELIGNYHGFDNLDNYPSKLTLVESRKRYSRAMYRVNEHALCD